MAARFVLLWILLLAAPALADDHASLADAVLKELNLARTSPKVYTRLLREWRSHYQGRYVYLPGTDSRLVTNEGVAAVDDAIGFVARQKPLPPLSRSSGLGEAALDLVRDQGKTGTTGHTGPRSGDMQKRVERHGAWSGKIAENIYYGSGDARMVVMQLVIDDGVGDRGHRNNIFDPSFRTAGVACGPHPEFRTVCVIDFAGSFRKTRSRR